jgi:ankyrin repeat protein
VFGLASQDRAHALADKLCDASARGDLERVRVLLTEGADLETTTDPAGATPLLLACANGHLRVAELLIEKGADVQARNTSRQNALTLAAQGGHRQLADYLMSRGVMR